MKTYKIQVIRWTPEVLDFEIASENCLNAKQHALETTRKFSVYRKDEDRKIPIKTTLLSCKRLK